MRRGRFITLEGGEGGGKTTQLKQLQAWLEARGIAVCTTREPGGSPGAEYIRSLLLEKTEAAWDPLSEILLFTAARRDHVQKVILPAIETGIWVLCDRFYDSTLAYQAYALDRNRALPDMLHRIALGGLRPDHTFILDLPVEEGLRRARKVTGERADRFESRPPAFHEKLRRAFLDIAAADPARYTVVDAGGSPATVTAAIVSELAARFRLPEPAIA